MEPRPQACRSRFVTSLACHAARPGPADRDPDPDELGRSALAQPASSSGGRMISPRCGFVVLEEHAPEVISGRNAVKYRIHDPGGTIDDIEWGVEAMNSVLRAAWAAGS